MVEVTLFAEEQVPTAKEDRGWVSAAFRTNLVRTFWLRFIERKLEISDKAVLSFPIEEAPHKKEIVQKDCALMVDCEGKAD